MDKLAAIADNRRFLSVPTRELPALAASFLEGAAESGTVLIEEGRPNDVLYLLVEGMVQISCGGRHLAFVHAGDYFGEDSEREAGPARARATALTPIRFLCAVTASAKNSNRVEA